MNKIKQIKRGNRMNKKLATGLMLLLSFQILANDKAKLGRDIKEQLNSEKITQDSQAKVDTLDIETQKLLDEYKRTLQKIENTQIYNAQLEKLIQNQVDEQESLKNQIASIKETNEGVVPFMLEMLATLDKMVENDTPFLPIERKKRVADLKEMMNRADVSTSEKFRRILEAYQVENEYGRTLEAYRGKLTTGKKDITVDFLRVGRLALAYQTLDQKKQGVWDKTAKKWVELDDDYRRSITTGLKVARKQTAPELLTLPLKKETL
ncbi:MAG: hypothetical protein CME65_14790 [Halobacteriovoraceae bacterium]|nr:hypothetical protein [Halobacteriovoraceae bacterium]